jgi:hypothetical protein
MNMTGCGKSRSGMRTVDPAATRVLPVLVFFNLGIATISPGPALVTGVCFLPTT